MAEFLMPSLGADMTAGTLLDWYVKPGDAVKRGDIVALVDTDKAAIEIEIFEEGVVGELLVAPGERAPVGSPMATILPPGQPRTLVPVRPAIQAAIVPEEAPRTTPAPIRRAVHATPSARRLAAQLDIDLSSLSGSGRHGVITRADVELASATPAPSPAAQTVPPPPRRRVSPLARRLAAEQGVDLDEVTGSGSEGMITAADVERVALVLPSEAPAVAAETPRVQPVQSQAPPLPVERPAPEPLPAAPRVPQPPDAGEPPPPTTDSRASEPVAPATSPVAGAERQAAMRRAIGAAMSKAKREIPHYYLATAVDLSRALSWLEETNLQRPVTERLLPAVLLLKATALAVSEVPEMNGFWREEGFAPGEGVHPGVSISLRQGGLIAPAIHDADRKEVGVLMSELRDLVRRARSLQLRSSELTDATLTVTNLGDQGVDTVFGIIYPPQVALVGFGRIRQRPWAENGLIGARPLVDVTLAADHRASDGHRGGLFLAAIERLLQDPGAL